MTVQAPDTTRDRILEAAGKLFAERGFEATTIRDICQAACANLAAVNYYFRDKERLYVEAVVRAHRSRIEQASIPDWDADTTPREKLADFITTFFRRIHDGPDNSWHSRLIMREILNPTAACAEIAQSNVRPQFEILQAILRELLPDGTSDEELHLTAFSIVGQCLFYYLANPIIRNLVSDKEFATYQIDKLAKHVTEFTSAALSNRAARPTRAESREGAKR